MQSYICYTVISLNPKFANRTYTGITNNSSHRLRQHNGEIKGGARATNIIKPVKYYIEIINLTKIEALSIERTIHNMKKRYTTYRGIKGIHKCITELINLNKINKDNVIYYE